MIENDFAQLVTWLDELVWDKSQWLAVLSTFFLIAAAEMGDKSQLVCMTLAARHRPWPVLLGSMVAFAFLNALAVIFGAALAAWLPRWLVGTGVALLFAGFGFHALLQKEEEEDEDAPVVNRSGHGIFFTTLILIFMAEFGDKTQIAVAGLGTTLQPLPVWLGATLSLTVTSGLGIVAGRTILQRLPIHLIHRVSGLLFLGLAVLALGHSLPWPILWEFAQGCWEEFSACRLP